MLQGSQSTHSSPQQMISQIRPTGNWKKVAGERGGTPKLGAILKGTYTSIGAHLASVAHVGEVTQRGCLTLVDVRHSLLRTTRHCSLSLKPSGRADAFKQCLCF